MIRRREFLLSAALPAFRQRSKAGTSQREPRCILINLTGGPSHIDTFDPKPDASSEVRGPFRSVRTNVPGIKISEIFPRLAKRAHLYTLIRSVYQTDFARHAPVFENALALRTDRLSAAADLIEKGERTVTIHMASSWDAHGWGPFPALATYRDTLGPILDRELSTLLDRLCASGLLAETRVIAVGEFGRTPRINPSGGRDHWALCRTAITAGGGFPGGEVWGSSDAIGTEPRNRPIHIRDLTSLAVPV